MLQSQGQQVYEIFFSNKILNFFLQFLTKKYYLNFYGGEPLLSFDLIKEATAFLIHKNNEFNKRPYYSITTNGSLLSEEIIQFLDKHKFSVVLSFDGLAQDIQRKKGSFEQIVSCIKEILKCTNIDLEVNSVFNSDTVDYLSESIQFIMSLNVPNIHFSLSTIKAWDQDSVLKLEIELKKLRKAVHAHYKKNGNIPLLNSRENRGKGIFYCAAGKDRLAITPEGGVWGCFLFPDYFRGKENSPEYKKFYFGSLDNFIENYKNIYPRISSNYSKLSMDNFSTSTLNCFLCPELENCAVCPINAAYAGAPLGKIPRHVCEIQKIKIREIKSIKSFGMLALG